MRNRKVIFGNKTLFPLKILIECLESKRKLMGKDEKLLKKTFPCNPLLWKKIGHPSLFFHNDF